MKRIAGLLTFLVTCHWSLVTALAQIHSPVPAYVSNQPGTLGQLAPGGVCFADAAGDIAQNNAKFSWNNSTTTLSVDNLTINGTCIGCGPAGTVTSVSGTANQIASSGGATPVLSITSPVTLPGSATITGLISSYDGLTTAGLGIPVQVGVVRAVAQAAGVGSTTIFTVGAADAMFDAKFALNCTTTSAAATVNITLGWTDTGSQAQTATLGSAVVCTALGASSIGSLTFSFSAKAASNITYSTAIVNTPTYDIRGALYQDTIN